MHYSPIIGITCAHEGAETGKKGYAFDLLKCEYHEKISAFGALPILLPNLNKNLEDDIASFLTLVDGVIFSGGLDMHPSFYNEDIHASVEYIAARDGARDDFELALARHILQHESLPVLGICRGHQLLNVAAGGSLHQDISVFRESNSAGEQIEHRIIDGKRSHHIARVLNENSRAANIFGTESFKVNSSHHQFVNTLGQNFIPTTFAPDGAIEAAEIPGERFFMTVQWHPEAINDQFSAKLFTEFVLAAKKFSQQKSH